MIVLDIPQVHGISKGDETAPVVGHESWGGAHNQRPDELFQLFEPPGGIQPARQRRRMVVKNLRVIDRDNRWMWHWDDVPVTCCSSIGMFSPGSLILSCTAALLAFMSYGRRQLLQHIYFTKYRSADPKLSIEDGTWKRS